MSDTDPYFSSSDDEEFVEAVYEYWSDDAPESHDDNYQGHHDATPQPSTEDPAQTQSEVEVPNQTNQPISNDQEKNDNQGTKSNTHVVQETTEKSNLASSLPPPQLQPSKPKARLTFEALEPTVDPSSLSASFPLESDSNSSSSPGPKRKEPPALPPKILPPSPPQHQPQSPTNCHTSPQQQLSESSSRRLIRSVIMVPKSQVASPPQPRQEQEGRAHSFAPARKVFSPSHSQPFQYVSPETLSPTSSRPSSESDRDHNVNPNDPLSPRGTRKIKISSTRHVQVQNPGGPLAGSAPVLSPSSSPTTAKVRPDPPPRMYPLSSRIEKETEKEPDVEKIKLSPLTPPANVVGFNVPASSGNEKKKVPHSNNTKRYTQRPRPPPPPSLMKTTSEEEATQEDKAAILIQKNWKGYHERKLFAKKKSKARHRGKVLNELLETERTFVRGLTVMMDYYNRYRGPTKDNPTPKFQLSMEETSQIFLNVPQIHKVNRKLLDDLELKIANNSSPFIRVGDLFIRYAPFFKSYKDYCQGYDSAISCLRQVRLANPGLDNDITEFQKSTNNLPLASLQITPVQRIPRYVLLLKDLLKHTWEDHVDYKDINHALVDLEDIANKVNTGIAFAENTHKVLAILNELTGVPEDTEFVIPSRYFVREGPVQFCNLDQRHHKEFKDHILYLFNDAIVFARAHGLRKRAITSQTSASTVSRNNVEVKRKQFRGLILLAPGQVSFRLLEGQDQEPTEVDGDYEEIGLTNAFYIQTPRRTFIVKCPSAADRHSWLTAFETCMQKLSLTSNISTANHQSQSPYLSTGATGGTLSRIAMGSITNPTHSFQNNTNLNTLFSNSPHASLTQPAGPTSPTVNKRNTTSFSGVSPVASASSGNSPLPVNSAPPEATIIDAVTRYNKKGKEHVAYVLQVSIPNELLGSLNGGTTKTIVYRRYREFESIKKLLEKKFNRTLSELPAKHYFRNLSKEVVTSRRVMLQGFLLEALADPEIRSCSEFLHFLTVTVYSKDSE